MFFFSNNDYAGEKKVVQVTRFINKGGCNSDSVIHVSALMKHTYTLMNKQVIHTDLKSFL